MKRKDLNDLKEKTIAELEKLASDLVDQMAGASLKLRTKKEKNTNLVKNLKISLAQVLSIKKAKEV